MSVAPADFRIALARPWHVDGILALIHALAEYEDLVHELTLDRQGLHDAMFGTRPYVETLIAREAEAERGEDAPLLGYALCFKSFSTFRTRAGLYLEDLFVLPGARRRGIGQALLRRVCARATAFGYARVEWSVLDWNAPAIAFYKGLGAVHQPEWQRFRLEGEALARVAAAEAAPPGSQ